MQDSRKQTGAGRRTRAAGNRNRRKAASCIAGKQRASIVTAFRSAEYMNRITPNTLAVAVSSALRVSRQQPCRYLLAATLISTSAIVQAQGFPAVFNLSDLNGSNGFVINGSIEDDKSGIPVSNAGDINGDGVDDIIIGADEAQPFGTATAGESYVVFGSGEIGNSGSLNLSDLDGINGFLINGVSFDPSVSDAGDINGDGVDDVIIGAPVADSRVGKSYVVFGGAGLANSGSLNVSSLNGANGFIINGVDDGDGAGRSVSGAGDINGDGVDDVIISAILADPNGLADAGESYVVFGSRDIGSSGLLNLSDLDGLNGFVINGINEDDLSGNSVSGAGDINGDGMDDVIIGAAFADPNGTNRPGSTNAGESYVVFGGTNVGGSGSLNLSSLDGVNGFKLNGDDFDNSGVAVSGAGDVNGDGIDDVIIGARFGTANGVIEAGRSYVVFGGAGIGSSGQLNLSELDGVNGFVINGIDEIDRSGVSVSDAGDVNGDGVNDIIIGSERADANGVEQVGQSYVVFGGGEISSGGSLNLSDLDGTNGFVINGIDEIDRSGVSVSGAGDINGDGVSDVIIGAPFADPNGVSTAGESYVVFGVPNTVTPTEGPDNDQFENARYLNSADKALVSGLTLTIKGTNSGATAQSGEPEHFIGDAGLPPGPKNSIWYRWTADADQVIEIDTAGSEVSTVLVAYTGATLSELHEVATGIDNVQEVARIRLAMRVDQTYHFAVDGYESKSEGYIQLNLRQPRLDPTECTIKGTNGSDNLVGTTGPDVICALDGNDFIKSLGGDDIIFAGKGDDLVSSGNGNDVVFGEAGNDTLAGGPGNDILIGGEGHDQLSGGKDDDAVFGGSGADRLFGASGNDDIFGEMGGDRLFGGKGNDYSDGGAFKDRCYDRVGEDTFVSC